MVEFNINNDLRFDCASKSRLFVCANSFFFFTADGGFCGKAMAIDSTREQPDPGYTMQTKTIDERRVMSKYERISFVMCLFMDTDQGADQWHYQIQCCGSSSSNAENRRGGARFELFSKIPGARARLGLPKGL